MPLTALGINLRDILDRITDAFIVIDSKFNYLYLNKQAGEIAGNKPDDLLGKSMLEVDPNFKQTIFYKKYKEAFKSQKMIMFEHFYPELNKWVYVRVYPIKDYLSVFFGDVTDLKKVNTALEESEQRYRKLVELSPEPIGVHSKGKITYINQSGLKMLGAKNLSDVIGEPVLKFVHPSDHQLVKQRIAHTQINKKEVELVEERFVRLDGEVIDVEVAAIPTTFLGEAATQVVARDITDRKKLERQKDDFLATASHELKTPITTIKAYTQILQKRFEKNPDNQSKDYLEKINSHLNRLTTLVSELLDATKAQSGKLPFHRSKFSIDQLVKEVCLDLQKTTTHKMVIKVESKIEIFADRNRVEQVLINLIENAIKYSPNGKKVVVTTQRRGNQVLISVKDQGIGIDTKHQALIFDRFFRGSGAGMETFPGLGLGLFISSEIIKLHGGEIWVKSKLGKGSTFCFTIPIKPLIKKTNETKKERITPVTAVSEVLSSINL